ncbi:hypothetical protein [Thauera humireducens]
MSTTRLLVIVLILLNALAFAGVKGWIAGTAPAPNPSGSRTNSIRNGSG